MIFLNFTLCAFDNNKLREMLINFEGKLDEKGQEHVDGETIFAVDILLIPVKETQDQVAGMQITVLFWDLLLIMTEPCVLCMTQLLRNTNR